MKFTDYILLAFRNTSRQKLRSILTIFAIVIGATSVTIMLALVTGAKSFFYQQFESTGALQQVIVNQRQDLNFEEAQYSHGNCNDCVKLSDDLAGKITALPHVEGLARKVPVYAFESMTYNSQKLVIKGTDAYDANGIIKQSFLAGREFRPTDGAGKIILSKEYADKMGYKNKYDKLIGQKVSLTTQSFFTGEGAVLPDPVAQWQRCLNGGCDQDNNPNPQKPTTLEAEVVGVVSEEGPTIRFPIEWARGLASNRWYEVTKADRAAQEAACRRIAGNCSIPPKFTLVTSSDIDRNGYSNFVVKVDQTSNAETVASAIKKLGVGAVTAESYIQDQIKMFNILGLILGGIGGIALLVAAIGVINTMIMAVLERTKEIGVMRAVGATRRTVSWLFTFEAALLGFWGGVLGVGVGYGLTLLANSFINKQLSSNGILAHNIIGLPLWLVLTVIGSTTVIGMLAGLYPARRAAKLDPVEALHYE